MDTDWGIEPDRRREAMASKKTAAGGDAPRETRPAVAGIIVANDAYTRFTEGLVARARANHEVGLRGRGSA